MEIDEVGLVYELACRLDFSAGECEELISKLWERAIMYSDYGYGCDDKINASFNRFLDSLRSKV